MCTLSIPLLIPQILPLPPRWPLALGPLPGQLLLPRPPPHRTPGPHHGPAAPTSLLASFRCAVCSCCLLLHSLLLLHTHCPTAPHHTLRTTAHCPLRRWCPSPLSLQPPKRLTALRSRINAPRPKALGTAALRAVLSRFHLSMPVFPLDSHLWTRSNFTCDISHCALCTEEESALCCDPTCTTPSPTLCTASSSKLEALHTHSLTHRSDALTHIPHRTTCGVTVILHTAGTCGASSVVTHTGVVRGGDEEYRRTPRGALSPLRGV